MDEQLVNLLEKTKLNRKQSQVYLALLQLGEATISQVAETSKIKRTNVYSIVSELQALGFVQPVTARKVKTYSAADPNKLVGSLKQGALELEEMLPYLRSIQKKTNKPYVRYYSGIEDVKAAYSQIYRPKEARYLTSISTVREAFPEEVMRWQKAYLSGKARPGGKHLITNTDDDETYEISLKMGKQSAKRLPPGLGLKIDIALADGDVFLTSFDNPQIQLTVIRSLALYEALVNLYDLAWDKIRQ